MTQAQNKYYTHGSHNITVKPGEYLKKVSDGYYAYLVNEDADSLLEFSNLRHVVREYKYSSHKHTLEMEHYEMIVDNLFTPVPRRVHENETAYVLANGRLVPYTEPTKVVWLTDEAHEVTTFMSAGQTRALFEKKAVSYDGSK